MAINKGNVMKKLVYGVGINDSTHVVSKGDGWRCPYYKVWQAMIGRCFSKRLQKINKSYIGCTVSDEWIRFSLFMVWMKGEEWKGKQLDKDIIKIGNKHYCPEFCCFVSPQINALLVNCEGVKGCGRLKGYKFNKGNGKYYARISIDGESVALGTFDTGEEALSAYVNRKYQYIISKANKESDVRVKIGLTSHAELFIKKHQH